METKTLKLDSVKLVQKKNELRKRDEKAQAYSAKVQRKRRREIFSKVRAFALYTLLIGGTFAALSTAYARDYGTTTELPVDRTETAVLVDIDEDGYYIYQTEDGHEWAIMDAPEMYVNIEFNNNGTEDVKDDIIVGVESVK